MGLRDLQWISIEDVSNLRAGTYTVSVTDEMEHSYGEYTFCCKSGFFKCNVQNSTCGLSNGSLIFLLPEELVILCIGN